MAQFEMTDQGKKFKSVGKAIKAFCKKCIGGSIQKVMECTNKDECELFAYRCGKNPFRTTRVFTDEQREAARDRMMNTRSKRGSIKTSKVAPEKTGAKAPKKKLGAAKVRVAKKK